MASFTNKFPLLRQSKRTENKIEQYLDRLTESQLIFIKLWHEYLEYGARSEQFAGTMKQLNKVESIADELQRSIETLLFEKTLIPDLRADVMTLLERLDDVINLEEAIGIHLQVERPVLPKQSHVLLFKLLDKVQGSIDNMVLCVRSFLTDLERVREYNRKTIFFESEANQVCTDLKISIFDSELPLENKVQLRYFIDRVEELAKMAEDIVDKVAIYTLKRAV